MRKMRLFTGIALLSIVLAGCKEPSLNAPPPPPSVTAYGPMNDAMTSGGIEIELATNAQDAWWHDFASEKLNTLINTAFTHSPTIEAAQARMHAAEAEVLAVRGETALPQSTLQAGSKQEKNDLHVMGMPATIPNPDAFTLTNLAVHVEYNFDWNHAGRYKRAIAAENLAEQREELKAARIALAENIVAAVFELVSAEEMRSAYGAEQSNLEQQIQILRRQIQAGAMPEEKMEGLKRSLDNTRDAMETARLSAEQARRRIAVLAGSEPGSDLAIPSRISDFAPVSRIAVVVPSSLVRNRPEIRAAEIRMKSASANAGLAAANLYPTFTLKGDLSTERRTIADLAKGFNLWSIGGSMSEPILNRKALRAQKAEAIEQYNAALADYRERTLEGLLETSLAIAELKSAEKHKEIAEDFYQSQRKSEAVTERRFQAGSLSELAAIVARGDVLRADRNQTEMRVRQMQAVANLMAATACSIQ